MIGDKMKKIYILLVAMVILLFTAGIYAMSSDIDILNTQDTQNNDVNEKNVISDLGKNTTSDNSSNSKSNSGSFSNLDSSSILDTIQYKVVTLNRGGDVLEIYAKYRPSFTPFTEEDYDVVFVDENGALYIFDDDRDYTAYWEERGLDDSFNPELMEKPLSDSDPKIVAKRVNVNRDENPLPDGVYPPLSGWVDIYPEYFVDEGNNPVIVVSEGSENNINPDIIT